MIPPMIENCPSDITETVSQGNTVATASWIEPTATDDSGMTPTRARSHSPGSSFPLGTTSVSYTFADGAGNRATCVFNVIVTGMTVILLFKKC